MEEILQLSLFFPNKVSDPELQNYIDHHFVSLYNCCKKELYSSAYPHLHILYMIFIYLQLFRISEEKEKEFELCWVGMRNEEKVFSKNNNHPLSFACINEKTVFRFFRLVNFDDGTIGNISSLIKKRNDHMHAKGKIYCKNENELNQEVKQYLKCMETIIQKQNNFLTAIYNKIINGFDKDYLITSDDIETYFKNFSVYELKFITKNKNDILTEFLKENY